MKDVIIPPIPTPFVNEQVSIDKLRSNLDRLKSTKINGVPALGSNGESVFLMESFRNGNIEDARRLESVLLPMTKSVMKHGPGGIKAAIGFIATFAAKVWSNNGAVHLALGLPQNRLNARIFVTPEEFQSGSVPAIRWYRLVMLFLWHLLSQDAFQCIL